MAVLAAFIFAFVMVTLVLVMLRRKKLREKYAVLWLLVGSGSLILAGWPGLLAIVSSWLGVEVPSNLLFALSIVLLIGVALHLSWELSVVEDETRVLAEEVAILEAAVGQLRADMNGRNAVEGRNGQPNDCGKPDRRHTS